MKKIWALLILVVTSLCHAEYDPQILYLTWQRSPETTMTVNWITSPKREEDLIEYRRWDEEVWQQAVGSHQLLPENVPYLIHAVELTNLSPGSSYELRTGSDGKTHKFRTAPDSTEETVRFVVGGDMYHDEIEYLRQTNKQAAKTSPHFALVGGDIAYAAPRKLTFLPQWLRASLNSWEKQDAKRWFQWLMAWKEDMVTPEGFLIPLVPVIGNHDTTGGYAQAPLDAPFFYTFFPMPGEQGFNVLDFGNYMSIFMLDSGHTHPIEGAQTFWLWEALSSRQSVPNKFAFYHVPAYPSVRKLSDSVSTEIRLNWVPLFEEYGLTAAFENHDHAYKRTHPIRQNQIHPQGVLYLGDGAWGVKRARRPKTSRERWYLAFTEGKRHFVLASIHGSIQRFTAISSEGEILDQIER